MSLDIDESTPQSTHSFVYATHLQNVPAGDLAPKLPGEYLKGPYLVFYYSIVIINVLINISIFYLSHRRIYVMDD